MSDRVRAVIVDDEPLARRGIRQLAAAHPDIDIIRECRNGREAIAAIESLRPDLVFLDVQMPELSGFDVITAVGPARMPFVIFVTAYDDFAVKAFEAHALDYLVKPLAAERFATALERGRERMRSAKALDLARSLAEMLAAQTPAPANARVVVPTSEGELILDVAEIDWVQARDYYAAVHTRGHQHLVRESLAALEQRLDPTRFVRVHRSAIVSIERIRELRLHGESDSVVVLRDGTEIPVSRRRRTHVSDLIRSLHR